MIVALFAGPGGACAGIEAATGLKPIGIEYEPNAVATRDAAGHVTIPADLADLSPCFINVEPRPDGLWGSPPCPAFSAAGKREGHDDLEELCWTARHPWFWDVLADGWYRKRWSHPDSHLIAQTFRWIGHHRPTWVALEQVPDVLPVWQALSHGLEGFGYSSWAGVLNAADYGVPQTRRRAFFMARLGGNVRPPAPTHAKQPEPVLFGDELAPWVTMADALIHRGGLLTRWAYERPATTVQCDARVAPPGHKAREDGERQFGPGTVRCAPWELGLLQGFHADYPWQGSKTAQFQQIGNAVPPPMAAAIVRELIR